MKPRARKQWRDVWQDYGNYIQMPTSIFQIHYFPSIKSGKKLWNRKKVPSNFFITERVQRLTNDLSQTRNRDKYVYMKVGEFIDFELILRK